MVEKLTKERCVDWLNYRLSLNQPQIGIIQNPDVEIIIDYIWTRKEQVVDRNQVVESIQLYSPESLWVKLDVMVNWMIDKFQIKTDIKEVRIKNPMGDIFAAFMNEPQTHQQVIRYY